MGGNKLEIQIGSERELYHAETSTKARSKNNMSTGIQYIYGQDEFRITVVVRS